MAKLTRIKILTTGATTSAPSNMKTGELAYSYVSGTQANNGDRLYIGTGAEDAGTGFVSNVDIIGGKYFTNLLDHVHGTTTANSALVVDANKHVSELNIASLALEASGGTGQVEPLCQPVLLYQVLLIVNLLLLLQLKHMLMQKLLHKIWTLQATVEQLQ